MITLVITALRKIQTRFMGMFGYQVFISPPDTVSPTIVYGFIGR